jgi:hypothetical protein
VEAIFLVNWKVIDLLVMAVNVYLIIVAKKRELNKTCKCKEKKQNLNDSLREREVEEKGEEEEGRERRTNKYLIVQGVISSGMHYYVPLFHRIEWKM